MLQHRDLQDGVALVTGGGSGLGRATCRELAGCGTHVLVADIDLDTAQDTVDLVQQDGGSAQAVPLDVADPTAVDEVVGQVSATYGPRFDLLVSNAGTDRDDLVDVDDDRWLQVFGVNVHGPTYVSRACMRHLRATHGDQVPDRLADVVCIVSISALTVGAGAGAHNASKAAMHTLAEVMQTESRRAPVAGPGEHRGPRGDGEDRRRGLQRRERQMGRSADDAPSPRELAWVTPDERNRSWPSTEDCSRS